MINRSRRFYSRAIAVGATFLAAFMVAPSATADEQEDIYSQNLITLAETTSRAVPNAAISDEEAYQRARAIMDKHGCEDAVLTIKSPLLSSSGKSMVGLAHWDEKPQRISLNPGAARDLERTTAHECAHLLQYQAYQHFETPQLSAAYTIYPHLNELTGLSSNLGAERITDCMTYRWGYPVTGAYTRDLEWCATYDYIVDAILAGEVPPDTPPAKPEPTPEAEPKPEPETTPEPTPVPSPNPTPTPTPNPVPSSGIPSDDGSSTRGIDDGGIGGVGNQYFLNDTFSAYANVVFRYGNTNGRVYVGDWNGDGKDTLAYRIGNTFYVRNSNSTGAPNQVFSYGRANDRVYVGDWNGDGKDTFAVRRGKTYHVKNSLGGGDADAVIHYGRANDDILVGDWNGDRKDTFAVRRGKVYHVKNSMSGGDADQVVNYGRKNDDVYVGDWDGNGTDSFAVRRDKTYYVANKIRGGAADFSLVYGRMNDTTLVGDWNGDGKDTLGIRRP